MPDGQLGLPEMVADCIRACDTDMRRELWGGIVVSGGGSLLPGLTDRLQARLGEIVPQTSMKVNVEGAPLVTLLHVIGSNGPSPNAPVGNQLVPSQSKVICLG